MKDKVFFPIVFILAIFAIYFAINPINFLQNKYVIGQNIGDKIVIHGKELNHINAQLPFIARENTRVNGKALGPRIIAENKIALDGASGAKILFDKKLVGQFKGKALKLVIIALPIKNSKPKNIAIGMFGDGKTHWKTMNSPEAEKPIILEFNDEIQNKEGIIINPSLEGEAKGIELQAIAIKII